jgi:hypothetical protein
VFLRANAARKPLERSESAARTNHQVYSSDCPYGVSVGEPDPATPRSASVPLGMRRGAVRGARLFSRYPLTFGHDGHVVSYRASGRGPQHRMVVGHMSGDAADNRAGHAANSIRGSYCTAEG